MNTKRSELAQRRANTKVLAKAETVLSVLVRLFHSNYEVDTSMEDIVGTENRVLWLACAVDRGVRNSNLGRSAVKWDEMIERQIALSNTEKGVLRIQIDELKREIRRLKREKRWRKP